MRDFKDLRIAVAGTGYVGLSIATLLAQHHQVTAVDVIAEKGDVKIAIQTKCYNGVVGNSAIQEIVAGMKYYDADKAMVITNSTFTRSAIELADKNDVQLWDRKTLIEKIDEVL